MKGRECWMGGKGNEDRNEEGGINKGKEGRKGRKGKGI